MRAREDSREGYPLLLSYANTVYLSPDCTVELPDCTVELPDCEVELPDCTVQFFSRCLLQIGLYGRFILSSFSLMSLISLRGHAALGRHALYCIL